MVLHFKEKQTPSICSMQQVPCSTSKAIGVSPRLSHIDVVMDCIIKVMNLVEKKSEAAEVSVAIYATNCNSVTCIMNLPSSF